MLKKFPFKDSILKDLGIINPEQVCSYTFNTEKFAKRFPQLDLHTVWTRTPASALLRICSRALPPELQSTPLRSSTYNVAIKLSPILPCSSLHRTRSPYNSLYVHTHVLPVHYSNQSLLSIPMPPLPLFQLYIVHPYSSPFRITLCLICVLSFQASSLISVVLCSFHLIVLYHFKSALT